MSITFNALKMFYLNPALKRLLLQKYEPYNLTFDWPYASKIPFLVGLAEYFCTHSLLLNSFR